MSFLNLKSYHFPIVCIMFFVGLTTAFAQEPLLPDTAADELDLKTLLAAIKQHNALLKSGEGEVVYTLGVPVDTDTHIVTGAIAFNKENTRFHTEKDFFHTQEKTTLLIPAGMWEITRNRKGEFGYHFTPERYFSRELKLIRPFHDVDPRRWITLRDKDLATYLESKNFQIVGSEGFNDVLCYVLEEKDVDMPEKIWIAPDRGFRYLKHESRSLTPVDALDSDVPMEAPTVIRTTISYQQHGDVWFPKAVFSERAWVDFKPEDPIISGQKLEIKNFKINHDLPPETFTVDIPDDALIKVQGVKQELSKQEFLKQYGQPADN